jgi:hypothetical protein
VEEYHRTRSKHSLHPRNEFLDAGQGRRATNVEPGSVRTEYKPPDATHIPLEEKGVPTRRLESPT